MVRQDCDEKCIAASIMGSLRYISISRGYLIKERESVCESECACARVREGGVGIRRSKGDQSNDPLTETNYALCCIGLLEICFVCPSAVAERLVL